MPDIIKLKRSGVAAAVPSSLELGEVALNYADGKLFYKNSAGAIVEFGGAGSDSLLRSIFAPAAPTSVTAFGGDAQATVSWTAPSVLAQTPITDYLVQYSSNSGSTWTAFADGTSTATTATVTGLTNGTAYVFRVAGVNGVGAGAYSAASPSVTPGVVLPTISGLQLHLDASDASTLFDAISGGSPVAADGAVARWEDKSGNGRHAIQSDGNRMPTRKVNIQNGMSVVRFDGDNDFLDGATTPSAGDSRTCFLVYRSLTQSGGEIIQLGKWTSVNSRAFLMRQIHGGGSTFIGGDLVATNLIINGVTLPLTSFHLSTWRQTPQTRAVAYRHNKQLQNVSGTVQAFSAAGGYFVGKVDSSNNASGFHNSDVAEVLIYDSPLSDADLVAVENYLVAKWGIS